MTTKSKPLPRRAARLGRPTGDFSAREQILRGAADAFGRLGFANASVEDILQASGISRRTFYKSFRSKEDVFDAVSADTVGRLPELVGSAATAAVTPAAKLESGIDAYFAAIVAFGPLARAMLLEPFPSDSKFAHRREVVAATILENLLADQRAAGAPPVDPLLVQGLLAAAEHIAVRLASESSETLDVQRGRRVLLRLLGATLAAPGDPVPPLPLAPAAEAPAARGRRPPHRRG